MSSLEDKFLAVLAIATPPMVIDFGTIRLEFRRKWDDGLSRSAIRVTNRTLGMSVAPNSWGKLIKTLELNKISLDDLDRKLDACIDSMILHKHQDLSSVRLLFGDTRVDDVIDRGEVIDKTFSSILNKTKRTPLKLVKEST